METTKDIERHIDDIFNKLKIFKAPAELAVLTSLEVFEYHLSKIYESILDQFISEIAIVERKTGLQILIEHIILKCPGTIISTNSSCIEITEEMLSNASAALQFCQRYSIVSLAYWNLYDNLFNAKVNNRVIEFEYPQDIDPGRSILNIYLHDYKSKRIMNGAIKKKQLPVKFSKKNSIK